MNAKNKKTLKNIVLTGSIVAGSVIGLGSLNANATETFKYSELGSGGELRSALLEQKVTDIVALELSCGEKESKTKEAKCGEGKCGEDKKDAKANKEAKTKDAKCGEGKAGEKKADAKADKKDAKATKESKSKEAKCGEGKCGM